MSTSENEMEEIQMYCCLPFSYAVKYGLIKINTERVEVEISLKSSLSESEKEEIWDELYKVNITNIHPDFFFIIHCPWCGTHVSTVIDFEKSIHAGQYNRKENWEIAQIFGVSQNTERRDVCCRRFINEPTT